jgi:hypothetical protein
MLVVAAVLAITVFAFPAPAHAQYCFAVLSCDCGCCGADKGVWDLICYRYNIVRLVGTGAISVHFVALANRGYS